MDRILCGTETEYGLSIEGRGPREQTEDSAEFVQCYPSQAFLGWDRHFESPRNDLRGFQVKNLEVDPDDQQFVRQDRPASEFGLHHDLVLLNGARFYNDHGHPEYACPESWTAHEAAMHDIAGEQVLLDTTRAYQHKTGLRASLYKNNTDFSGASYGTHESYLVPRKLGFEALYRGVMPMLVVRQLLTGAGKAGSELGGTAPFQMSQRADFFMEAANLETLYRRPVFNTRDEPHADPNRYIRLHVISCDANRLFSCVRRRLALVRLALRLTEDGDCPEWQIPEPHRAFQMLSGEPFGEHKIPLKGSWTTAQEVLESYFAAAENTLELSDEEQLVIQESRDLLSMFRVDQDEFRRHVDWAAKYWLVDHYRTDEGLDWGDPVLQSVDLEYSNIDPEESLFQAMIEMGELPQQPRNSELDARLAQVQESTRARARGYAVRQFGSQIRNICWRSITFEIDGDSVEVDLDPSKEYPEDICRITDVKEFIHAVTHLPARTS